MTEPILLICGCQKYKFSLEQAIIRFTNPAYRVIGILGDKNIPTQFDDSILSLQVEDTYEALPKKIHAAFRWIHENFPDTVGIFKTDDDILLENKALFIKTVLENIKIPYWGFKQQILPKQCLINRQILKFENKLLIKPHPAVNFVHGAGYWVSKDLIITVIKSEMNDHYGPEDVYLAAALNKAGHIPKSIPLKFIEIIRPTQCERELCAYSIHTNPNNNGGTHCCYLCKTNKGHGPACQKILFNN